MKKKNIFLLLLLAIAGCKPEYKIRTDWESLNLKGAVKTLTRYRQLDVKDVYYFDPRGNLFEIKYHTISSTQQDNPDSIITYRYTLKGLLDSYAYSYRPDANRNRIFEISHSYHPLQKSNTYHFMHAIPNSHPEMTRIYDANGHLISEIKYGLESRSFQSKTTNAYNSLGYKIQTTHHYPDTIPDIIVRYDNDTNGNPITISYIHSEKEVLQHSSYTYDAVGNWLLKTTIADNGITTIEKQEIEYY